jgi:acyl-CoA synthetase (AMP-forming)/AMP-acid ligase II
MSIHAWTRLLAAMHEEPRHPVIAGDDEVVDGAALLGRSEAWAARLHARGLRRGDRVAVLAEAHAEAVAVMLGTYRAGLVYVPVNPRYRGAELDHVVTDCDAALLLCDPSLADERLQALPPTLPRFGLAPDPALPSLPAPPAAPSLSAVEPIADDETALLVYTSGTTGCSKGVRLSLAAVVANMLALTGQWRWSRADVLSLPLPLFHVHGLCIGIHGALLHGTTIRLHRRFDAAAIVSDFERGATVLMGVPTMYDLLLEHLEGHPAAAATLARARLYTAGSAALRPTVLERWQALTGHRILERYGMTETLITLGNPYDGERRPGSVGLPLPGCAVRVVDDAGHDVPPGEPGELWVRGPGLMQGYWDREQETSDAFTDGWFRTGDVAVADPDGYLRIVGRRSTDIIKSGGFKIAAPEIEEVLRRHPAVRDAAVVGVPDHRWGERIAAAVVAASETAPDPQELAAWVGRHLADHKKPRQIAIVSELPRNALGKLQKPRLVQVLRRPDDPEPGSR